MHHYGFYHDSGFSRYVVCFYWALTTMSTIGYGDISPETSGERRGMPARAPRRHTRPRPLAAQPVRLRAIGPARRVASARRGRSASARQSAAGERIFSCFVMVTGTCVYAYGVTSVISIVSGVNASNMLLMQRKDTPVGRGLGKTTGWTKRLLLNRRGVNMVNAVEYVRVDDAGLHVLIGGQPKTFEVDTVIICAGQEPERSLYDALEAEGLSVDLVGGAYEAAELDAKTAINQATQLAAAV